MADVPSERNRAVILLSGGLDSTTAAWLAKESQFDLFALSFDYGQRHRKELDAATLVARTLDVRQHQIVRMNLGDWSASSLTGMATYPPSPATASHPPGFRRAIISSWLWPRATPKWWTRAPSTSA